MLQNVHYFDQISNVRYANKVCFFRTYKTPQTLEITRIAGLLFKSTLFFAYPILRELPGLDPDWPL